MKTGNFRHRQIGFEHQPGGVQEVDGTWNEKLCLDQAKLNQAVDLTVLVTATVLKLNCMKPTMTITKESIWRLHSVTKIPATKVISEWKEENKVGDFITYCQKESYWRRKE
jgi:hypothetical protein